MGKAEGCKLGPGCCCATFESVFSEDLSAERAFGRYQTQRKKNE